MTQTQLIIKRLKARHGITSYRAAALLDVSRQAVSHWQSGKNHMDERSVLKVAPLLDERPEALLMMIAADKAKDGETAKQWLALARKLQRAVAAVVLVGMIAAQHPYTLPVYVYYVTLRMTLRFRAKFVSRAAATA